MTLVFQFGSNCSTVRMNGADRLDGAARPIGIAETVDEFQLAFDVWSKKNACAAANIVRTPGKKVWGVLYEVPDNRMDANTPPPGTKSFDEIEGPRYTRTRIKVRRPDGKIVEAFTYLVIAPQKGISTSFGYVSHVISGLREHGAPEEYIRDVKQLAGENNPCLLPYLDEI